MVVKSVSDFYDFFNQEYAFQLEGLGNYSKYHVHPECGEGFIERLLFPNGFEICFTEMILKKDMVMPFQMQQIPFEITYVMEGNIFIHYDDFESVNLCPNHLVTYYNRCIKGEMYLIKDRKIRYITLYAPQEFLETEILDILGLDPSEVYLEEDKINGQLLPHIPSHKVTEGLNALGQMDKQLQINALLVKSKALEIFSHVVKEAFMTSEEGEKVGALDERTHLAVDRACEIIALNYQSPYSVEELAYAVNLNTSRLKKSFKLKMEMTIFSYLRKIRMDKAKDLLAKEGFNVTEAAFAVGYTNLSHFARNFKNYYGANPKTFQKRL